MIRLVIAGAAGRMGARLIALSHSDDRFDFVGALEVADSPAIGADAGEHAGIGAIHVPIQDRTETEFDVLVDFTTAAGTMHWLDFCLFAKRPIVIGTTGHTPEQLAAIKKAAEHIAVLKSSNMSLGINVLLRLVGRVAQALGNDYDIEIAETHHRFKADAPSGTALALLDAILEATGRNKRDDVVYGRQGLTGPRPRGQIGMHALRVGDTVGEHEIHFGNLGETVTLRHSAHTRDTFAQGALRAAEWIAGRPAGLYTMQDVLGLDA
jgi:4-hydroxy-tetrahydrodipicolinate reductase